MITAELQEIHREAQLLIMSHEIQYQKGSHSIITHSQVQSSHHMIWTWRQNTIAINTFPDCPDITW